MEILNSRQSPKDVRSNIKPFVRTDKEPTCLSEVDIGTIDALFKRYDIHMCQRTTDDRLSACAGHATHAKKMQTLRAANLSHAPVKRKAGLVRMLSICAFF